MLVYPGEGANGSQIVRRDAQHGFEFLTRLVKLFQFDQRATEGDLRGQIPWMPRQPVAADRDRLLVIASAPVLLRELCKRDRRRVLLDPAAQRFDARVLCHLSGFYVCAGDSRLSAFVLRADYVKNAGAHRSGVESYEQAERYFVTTF